MPILRPNAKSNIFIIYLLVSFIFLIAYPFWIYFQNQKIRFVVFAILLLLFLISNFLLLKRLKNYSPEKEEGIKSPIKKDKLFILILIFAALIQIPFLFLPLTFMSDEIHYVSYGMYFAQAINSLLHGFGYLLVIFSILAGWIIFKFKEKIKNILEKRYLLFSILIAFISAVYFKFVSNYFTSYALQFAQKTIAEKAEFLLNGVKSIIFSFPILLFGQNEFAVRLPSLIAYLLSAIFLYKIGIEFFKSRKIALYSSIFLLFFQGFFYFGNLAYDVAIISFAITSSLYFFLKYREIKDFKYLFYQFIILTLIIIFDKKAVVLLLVYIVFMLADLIKEKKKKEYVANWIFVLFISGIIFLWYFVINSFLFINQIKSVHSADLFGLKYLFNTDALATNLIITHYIIGFFATILLLFGLIYALSKIKNNKLNLYLLIFYAVYILFFTAQKFSGLPKYMSLCAFIFALIIAQFLVFLEEKNSLFKILSILFSVFLVITTVYSAYSMINSGYLPLNPAFKYIKESLPNERFIKSMTPGPYNFYILKYNLNLNNFDPTIWQDAENQTTENLYEYMQQNNLTYAIFPLPTLAYGYYFYKPMDQIYKQTSCTWVDLCYIDNLQVKELISHKLIQDIYDSKTELFTKITEFNYGRNVLFIAKRNF